MHLYQFVCLNFVEHFYVKSKFLNKIKLNIPKKRSYPPYIFHFLYLDFLLELKSNNLQKVIRTLIFIQGKKLNANIAYY